MILKGKKREKERERERERNVDFTCDNKKKALKVLIL